MNGGMKLALIVAALTISGCDRRQWTRDEIREIAQESAPYGGDTALTMKHDADIIELKRQVEVLQKDVEALGSAHDSLVNTFNGNVRKDNEAAVRRMTAAGACGREWVTYPDGAGTWRNKDCTLKDLRP